MSAVNHLALGASPLLGQGSIRSLQQIPSAKNKTWEIAKPILTGLGLVILTAAGIGAALVLAKVVTLTLPFAALVVAVGVGVVALLALLYYSYKSARAQYALLEIDQLTTTAETLKEQFLTPASPLSLPQTDWDEHSLPIELAIWKWKRLQGLVSESILPNRSTKQLIAEQLKLLYQVQRLVNLNLAKMHLEDGIKHSSSSLFIYIARNTSQLVQNKIDALRAMPNEIVPKYFRTGRHLITFVKKIERKVEELSVTIAALKKELAAREADPHRHRFFIGYARSTLDNFEKDLKELSEGSDKSIPPYAESLATTIMHIVQQSTKIECDLKKKYIQEQFVRRNQYLKQNPGMAIAANTVLEQLNKIQDQLNRGIPVAIPDYYEYDGDDFLSHVAKCIADEEQQFTVFTQEIVGKYDVDLRSGMLFLRATRERTSLTKEMLSNVIAIAKEQVQYEDSTTEHRVHGHRFILITEQGKLDIVHIGEHLGSGSFGTVSKVTVVTRGEFLAFKENLKIDSKGRPVNVENTRVELLLESTVLESLHKRLRDLNESSEGFQRPPIRVVHMQSGDVGLMGRLYDCDLRTWMQQPHPLNERIQLCKQLMQAFAILTLRLEYQHYDIKPENILVRENRVDFSDLSGARPLPETGRADNDFNLYLHTHHYNCLNDHQNQEQAVTIGNIPLFRHIAVRRMLFSLGSTFFQLLSSGHFPYRGFIAPSAKEVADYPDTRNPFQDDLLATQGCSPEVIQVVRTMVSPAYHLRPSVAEALGMWNAI